MSNERDNQLATVSDYDVKRMIFADPVDGNVPDTTIKYKRIPISTLNEDKSIGDLLLPTAGELFSYGVSENTDPTTKAVNGHTLSLCLYNRDGPTEEQKQWVETFDRIVEHCKEYLVDNADKIEKYDLSMTELKKFNPLYWKREKGKIVEGTGPTLYAKLIASKKHNKITSMFFDYNDNPIDPLSLLGKYCHTNAVVKIESIFIGAKITLQVKLYEARCRIADTGMKPLLTRPKNSGRLLPTISDNTEKKQLVKSKKPAVDDSEKPAKKPAKKAEPEDDIIDDDDTEEVSQKVEEEEPKPKKKIAVKPKKK